MLPVSRGGAARSPSHAVRARHSVAAAVEWLTRLPASFGKLKQQQPGMVRLVIAVALSLAALQMLLQWRCTPTVKMLRIKGEAVRAPVVRSAPRSAAAVVSTDIATGLPSDIFDIPPLCELSRIPSPPITTFVYSAQPPYTLWLHPPAEDAWISGDLARGLPWEQRLQWLIRDTLIAEAQAMRDAGKLNTPHPKGGITRPIYVDIGANIGAHTNYVLSLGFELHAFEPMSHNMRLLRCSVAANFDPEDEVGDGSTEEAPWERLAKLSEAERTALSDAAYAQAHLPPSSPVLRKIGSGGKLVRPRLNQVALGPLPYDPSRPRICMSSKQDNQGHSFIAPNRDDEQTALAAAAAANAEQTGDAPAVAGAADGFECTDYAATSSLDHYASSVLQGRRITLLKLDVEGYELHVLQGMSSLLRDAPPKFLQLEVTPVFLRAQNSDPRALLRLMQSAQYSRDHRSVLTDQEIEDIMLRATGNGEVKADSEDIFFKNLRTDVPD